MEIILCDFITHSSSLSSSTLFMSSSSPPPFLPAPHPFFFSLILGQNIHRNSSPYNTGFVSVNVHLCYFCHGTVDPVFTRRSKEGHEADPGLKEEGTRKTRRKPIAVTRSMIVKCVHLVSEKCWNYSQRLNNDDEKSSGEMLPLSKEVSPRFVLTADQSDREVVVLLR